ncbi:MAG: hypothetical protein EP330_24705 [Deltaproteobacteria bacterium]|nr:MAG: hypothetical protein EP330_24705 [Deltaproteobacteria bacterium]
MRSLLRVLFALFLGLSTAHAQEAPEAPVLPLLAEPGGAEALAMLVDVPWEELGDGEAKDFPKLNAHWSRVSSAFFAYSTAMAQGQPVMREWSVVAPRMLHLGGLLATSGDALVSALPESDSTRAKRAAGVEQIRGGITKMTQGALIVLVEMPAQVRTPYVKDLAEALPSVLAAIPPAEAAALRAQARGAGALLPEAEAMQLETAAGQLGADLPAPPLVEGAPDRLLVAQTAAGWPGPLPKEWSDQLLTANWDRHATDVNAHKADAFALLVGGHAWLTALGEQRVDTLDTVAMLVDGGLRAGVGALTADVGLADRKVFAASLSELAVRATAVAAHYSPKDRAPLADVLSARVPGLIGALTDAEAEELRTNLRAVADKKLIKALAL